MMLEPIEFASRSLLVNNFTEYLNLSLSSGLEGVIDCLRNWRLDRRWGSDSVNEVESASDHFLQRRGNDGGDQEGKEEGEDKGEEVHPYGTSREL